MSYFVKKTKNKRGLYIQIYSGTYNIEKHNVTQKCYKSLGYYDELINAGDPDPIATAQRIVDELNFETKLEKETKKKEILKISSETTPIKNIGYFPLKIVLDKLKVQGILNLFQKIKYDFNFNVFEVMSALIFARVIEPNSKKFTYEQVFPKLHKAPYVSYDQILECCEFLGSYYEKFIELFTERTREEFGINTGQAYFDCTNFYFEIDREDDFRKKGPSKENKKNPIVGLGLLLDANMIPIGMKLYPGNESEKPVLREIIEKLKRQNQIVGKTIQVADKGLNCAENIISALKNKDGYLFSKSIKMLAEKEKVWVFNENGWYKVYDSDGKLKYKYKECIDDFPYETKDLNGKKVTIHLKEKRVLTYSPKLCEKQTYEIKKLVEKARAYCYSRAKKSECGESGKYIDFRNSDNEKAEPVIREDVIENDLKYCGYNLLVTSEFQMQAKEIYDVYHNLWRIEESFKVMKSSLDARPVFLQKENCIKGHFFICYIAILLIRLFQFKVMNNSLSTEEIMNFIRSFVIFKDHNNKLNNATLWTQTLKAIQDTLNIPLENLYFNKLILKAMHLE